MELSVEFWGASGTVTGSKYLVECRGPKTKRILVDAGMFQGAREWREKNWEDPPSSVLEGIDAVLLTHAHIDHTGILPRYFKRGLKCPVYCTKPTADLTRLLLLDSAALQEEEARFRAKEGRSRHHPPQPLYTGADAEQALQFLKPVAFNTPTAVVDGIEATWSHMGHILGAAAIRLSAGGKVITFSGDIGRYGVPILKDPEPVSFGDLLLIESTYGDRLHESHDPAPHLARVVKESVARGGVLVVPSFAVGRTQQLLYYLRELKEKALIPDVPIVIDSPMASDATELYSKYPSDYDEGALQIVRSGRQPFKPSKLYFTRSRDESKQINSIHEPMIIVAASGMLSGGRILHHLKQRISSPMNTILFVGYQPPGGRGAWIKSGAPSLRLFGEEVPIRAHIDEVSELSAHGDRDELLRWCRESSAKSDSGTPGKVAVVHGEPAAAENFASSLSQQLAWKPFVARYKEQVTV